MTTLQLKALSLVGNTTLLMDEDWRKQVMPQVRRALLENKWVARDPMNFGVRLTNEGVKATLEHLEGHVFHTEVVQLSKGAPNPFGAFTMDSVSLELTEEQVKDRPHVRGKRVFGKIILDPNDEFRVTHTLSACMPILCILEVHHV